MTFLMIAIGAAIPGAITRCDTAIFPIAICVRIVTKVAFQHSNLCEKTFEHLSKPPLCSDVIKCSPNAAVSIDYYGTVAKVIQLN